MQETEPNTVDWTDKKTVLDIVSQDGSALRHAFSDLRDDVDVVLTAVKQNPEAIRYASDNVKEQVYPLLSMQEALSCLEQQSKSFMDSITEETDRKIESLYNDMRTRINEVKNRNVDSLIQGNEDFSYTDLMQAVYDDSAHKKENREEIQKIIRETKQMEQALLQDKLNKVMRHDIETSKAKKQEFHNAVTRMMELCKDETRDVNTLYAQYRTFMNEYVEKEQEMRTLAENGIPDSMENLLFARQAVEMKSAIDAMFNGITDTGVQTVAKMEQTQSKSERKHLLQGFSMHFEGMKRAYLEKKQSNLDQKIKILNGRKEYYQALVDIAKDHEGKGLVDLKRVEKLLEKTEREIAMESGKLDAITIRLNRAPEMEPVSKEAVVQAARAEANTAKIVKWDVKGGKAEKLSNTKDEFDYFMNKMFVTYDGASKKARQNTEILLFGLHADGNTHQYDINGIKRFVTKTEQGTYDVKTLTETGKYIMNEFSREEFEKVLYTDYMKEELNSRPQNYFRLNNTTLLSVKPKDICSENENEFTGKGTIFNFYIEDTKSGEQYQVNHEKVKELTEQGVEKPENRRTRSQNKGVNGRLDSMETADKRNRQHNTQDREQKDHKSKDEAR